MEQKKFLVFELIRSSLSSGKGGKEVGRSDLKKIFIGLFFLLSSLIIPRLIQFQVPALLINIENSIINRDSGLLLLTATKLVFFNTLRHSPVIVGAFLLGEGISVKFRLDRLVFFLVLLIIPIFYRLISYIYEMQFVFTSSGFITIVIIVILFFFTAKINTTLVKIIILNLFMFGFDWLEVVPLLSQFGFSGGEIAQSIFVVADFIGANYILNFVGLSFSLMLIINAFILSKVVVDHENKLILMGKLRKIEMEVLRSRYFQEVKHLVHDLKTPLVTIQGLAGVISMVVEDKKIAEYTEKISLSVERIGSMISEILNENQLSVINIREVADFLKVHLSLEGAKEKVNIILDTNSKIYGNKYLLSRALINIIDNSLRAIDLKNDGFVKVKIFSENGEVKIIVEDNGKGIAKDNIEKIWELGYSKEDSTGLGLNFSKKVFTDHEGTINIESKLGLGTTVILSIPEVG